MDDRERAVIVEVLCSQALADHLGDVRDAEEKLWALLGVSDLSVDDPAHDNAWLATRGRLRSAGVPLPAYLLQADEDDEE